MHPHQSEETGMMDEGGAPGVTGRRGAVPALVGALLLGALGCSSSSSDGHRTPVACADLASLRDLGSQLSVVTNTRTGNSLEYIVVGDGASSDELIVMFPGTGGILPDWPTQMITNATISPKIVDTESYNALENAAVSLCHSYRLLLFDYAGVGEGSAVIEQTFDSVASDVDALLNDATTRYGVSASDVNVLGWSLGTHAADKFTFLSSVSSPDRRIHDVVLIATRPGGATDGLAIGNQAQCVSELLTTLDSCDVPSDFRTTLDTDAFKLTFPYVGQPPYDGADSGCTAQVDSATQLVLFDVTLAECLPDSQCWKMYLDQLFNRYTAPWSATHGVPCDVYVNQRQFDSDWNVCYCAAAGADFTSQQCSCSEPVEISSTNGGICQCQIPPGEPQAPSCSNCVDLQNRDQLTVINGYEDLFIQWTYGQELVRAYTAQYGTGKANIVTYPGDDGAGHGILLQHPKWTQEQIYAALTND
jgi:pimeloyl-ACP methyl ester carboxylesterase